MDKTTTSASFGTELCCFNLAMASLSVPPCSLRVRMLWTFPTLYFTLKLLMLLLFGVTMNSNGPKKVTAPLNS